MNYLFWTALLTLSYFTLASPAQSELSQLPSTGRLTEEEKKDLRKRIEAVGGCNANVCFAIDGSRSIRKRAFRNEKNFVLDVVSVIAVDQAVELAAVQYGIASSAISPLTPNVVRFIRKVKKEKQLKSSATFLVAGLNYCISQLFRRPGEANKIVVLGDGRSNIGSSAVARAKFFRKKLNGEVCAVGAGFTDDAELLAIAGGDPGKVFQVKSFLDVLALQAIIEDLVEGICNIKLD